jgi:CRISPR-associated protein Csb1
MIGINAQPGKKTSSRIDPLGIMVQAGPLYQAKGGGWTLAAHEAIQEKKNAVKLGSDGKPSEANHGNVTPTIADGGFTIDRAVQTTVVSLAALRRLRFPINGKPEDCADQAARTVLAALALCAAAIVREQGCDLRSRCQLHPTEPVKWEMIGAPGEAPVVFALSGEQACKLYDEAVAEAKRVGLPWHDDKISLQPSPQLVELVRRSRDLAAKVRADGEEGN